MNPGLTTETELAILNLAHAFDGYAYAEQVWRTPEKEIHATLGQRMMQVQESGRLFLKAEDNFATNFYLHRTFHHWGWLPSAKSTEWYTMIFLYLHLYRIPVPSPHRHELHAAWASRPKGAAESAAAELRGLLRRG